MLIHQKWQQKREVQYLLGKKKQKEASNHSGIQYPALWHAMLRARGGSEWYPFAIWLNTQWLPASV